MGQYFTNLLILLATVLGQGSSLKQCDFSTICAENQLPSSLKFLPGTFSKYTFLTTQHLSIGNGDGLQDSGTVELKGNLVLRPRAGLESCALDLEITNLSVEYPEIGNGSKAGPRSDKIIGSIHAAFVPWKSRDEICLPIQDQWKDNLVRSLISVINPESTGFPSMDDHTNKSSCWLIPSLEMRPKYKPILQEENDFLEGGNWALEKIDRFIHLARNINVPQYAWRCFRVEVGQDGGGHEIVTFYSGQEERIVVSGSQMITNTSTLTTINLSYGKSDKSLKSGVVSTPEMFMAPLKFDPSPPRAMSSLMGYNSAIFEQLCGLGQDPDKLLEFMDKMGKVVRVLSIEELRNVERILKNTTTCDAGLSLYHGLLASSPSDATVEFMADLFATGGGNLETFQKFFYAINRPEELPFAGDGAVKALAKLLDDVMTTRSLSFEVDTSQLILSLVGVLAKIRPHASADALVDKLQEQLRMARHLRSSESVTQSKIDLGTELEAGKGLDVFLNERNISTEPSNCETNQFPDNPVLYFKCFQPCDSGIFAKFLNQASGPGVQIIAYLLMRKCPEFHSKFRPQLLNFLESEDGEVSQFVLHHSATIKDELSSETSPEPSKLGRSWLLFVQNYSHSVLSPSGYSSLGMELNMVQGNDGLPMFISLDLTYTSVNGVDRFLEVELMRAHQFPVASNPEKFNVFLALRASGGRTLVSKTIPLDTGKIKAMMQEFGQRFKNPEEVHGIKMKFKKMIDSYVQHIFENREVDLMKTFLLEDRLRQSPTMSGLPLKTRTRFNGALTFNYKWDVEWKDGEYFLNFEFHPALSWQRAESAAIGFGLNEIFGYEVGAHHSTELNFGVNFKTANDLRTFFTKLSFSSRHSKSSEGEEGAIFFKNSFKFLKLSRVQCIKDCTEVVRSGHVWSEEKFGIVPKSQLQNEVQLRDSWALLDGGKCFNKILRFGPSDPFHYEIVTICSLPDIHIFMHPSLRGNELSLEVKLYPENPTVNNTYAGKISFQINRKEHLIILGLSVDTPKYRSQFQVNFITSTIEQSLRLLVTLNGNTLGGEVYLKKIMLDNMNKSSDSSPRIRRTIQTEEPDIQNRRSPYSHKSYEFGVNGWIGDSKPVQLLQGGIIFVDHELLSLWMGVDSGGRLTKLETRLSLTVATNRNITQTLTINGFTIPSLMGDETQVALQIRNGFYGNFSVLGKHFVSQIPTRGPQPPGISASLNGGSNFTKLIRGSMSIPYSLRSRSSVNLVKIEFTRFELLDDIILLEEDSSFSEEVKRTGLLATLESDIFPAMSTRVNHSLSMEYVPNPSSDCEDCTTINTTGVVDVSVKYFTYPLKFRFSKVLSNVEANLGSLVEYSYKIDKDWNCILCPSTVEIKIKLQPEEATFVDLHIKEAPSLESGRNKIASDLHFQMKRGSNFDLEIDHKCSGLLFKLGWSNETSNSVIRLRLERTGRNYKLVGDSQAVVEFIPCYQGCEDKYSKIVTFVGKLSEDSWDEDMKIYWKSEDGYVTPKGNMIFLANDDETTYLNSSIWYDFRSQRLEDEPKLFSVWFTAKDYINAKLDVEKFKLLSKVDIVPKDFSLNTNFAWGGDQSGASSRRFFKGGVNSYSLENPRLRHFVFDTENEVKVFPVSESIPQLPLVLLAFLPHLNARLTSKTKLRIKSISQKFNVIFQLLPEESESSSPVLLLEWVLPTADKFSIKVKKQLKLRLTEDYNSSLESLKPNHPCLVGGHWVTMEQPGYEAFTSEMVVKGFCSSMFNLTAGKASQATIFETSFHHRVQHHEFFLASLDTEAELKGNFGYSVKRIGNENENDVNELTPVYNPFLDYYQVAVSRKFDISWRAVGRQNLAPTQLSFNYDNFKEEGDKDEKWAVVHASLEEDKFTRGIHISLNSSRINTTTIVETSKAGSSCFATVLQDGKLVSRNHFLSYELYKKEKSGSIPNTIFFLEGDHTVSRVFESWRNFEVTGNHRVQSPWLNRTWEDKIYSRLKPRELSPSIGAHSTHLFNTTVTKSLPEDDQVYAVLEIEIIPSCARSTLVSKLLTPERYTLHWNTSASSVLFRENRPLELSVMTTSYRGHTVTQVLYKVPGPNSTQYQGRLESVLDMYFLELEDDLGANVVDHKVVFHRTKTFPDSEPLFKNIEINSTTSLLSREGEIVFFHRDVQSEIFSGIGNASTDHGDKSLFFRGSFALSAPFVESQPQIAALSLNWDKGSLKSGRKGGWEGFARLGQVNDNTTAQICNRPNAEQWNPMSSPILPEKLGSYFQQTLFCRRHNCGDVNDCSNSFGSLWIQSQKSNYSTTHITTKDDTLVAKWSQGGICEASRVKNDTATTSSKRKNLSQECTATLTKVREKVPCLFGAEEQNCQVSLRIKAIEIWNKVWKHFIPVAVVADTILLGGNLIAV